LISILCPSRLTTRSLQQQNVAVPESPVTTPASRGVRTKPWIPPFAVIATRCLVTEDPAAAVETSVAAASTRVATVMLFALISLPFGLVTTSTARVAASAEARLRAR
jgi:hypothetical protein